MNNSTILLALKCGAEIRKRDGAWRLRRQNGWREIPSDEIDELLNDKLVYVDNDKLILRGAGYNAVNAYLADTADRIQSTFAANSKR